MASTTIRPGASGPASTSTSSKLGKVANDDRADWREAWALFPGSVAYVWHAGRYASTVQESLERVGLRGARRRSSGPRIALRLSRGHYHWQHEPCWYAVRKGPAELDRRPQAIDAVADPCPRGRRATSHGTQKPVECMKRPIENNSSPGQADLRAVQRVRHDHHCGRDDGPLLPRHRADAAVRRRRGRALAGVHRRGRHAGARRAPFAEVAAERQAASAA